MRKRFRFIVCIAAIACVWSSCKNDVEDAGRSILGIGDEITVFADTFSIVSSLDSCDAIISQPDSFLLGEIETDYGLLRASILTQLACPEGYSYPEGFTVDSVDSVCLFMYYSSWVGDANSPLALNAYMMDKGTFRYSGTYRSDLNISDYCSREKSILTNHRIVVASEKLDSIRDVNGNYIPMIRMRVNDDFMRYFGSIQNFESQESFNRQFHGLLIETSFGSSTMLNISDVALGVYYHFSYNKAGRDTVVNDMKAFYANSEVRTVNHLEYQDKTEWVEALQSDSDTYNYIIAPAGVYTRLRFPMERMTDSIYAHMVDANDEMLIFKRPYVNKAQLRVDVENQYTGSGSSKLRNDWLQPAEHMLLIKEESMDRFFRNRELPTDSCALLSDLTEGVDSLGNTVYYYTYDMSDFLTSQLRQWEKKENLTVPELQMVLVPVSVETSSTVYSSSTVSAVRQQQTVSATKIRSAKNGMDLKIVYSGF
ncbi:MAG: DUF4270 domain-containing protein [Paludibacteraceae bacterium]|nr:DUF4270 domain-containing protein [Paludibacteraceae bacterium]